MNPENSGWLPYTTGQADQLADLLGPGKGVKEVPDNQNQKMEEKSWQEDDLDFSDDGAPDFSNLEGIFENVKKRYFISHVRRKKGSKNIPDSDHIMVTYVPSCISDRQ